MANQDALAITSVWATAADPRGLLHGWVTLELACRGGGDQGRVCIMPKLYPSEFREDVVRVARGREAGVSLEQVAADFGVHPMTLHKWLCRAAVRGWREAGCESWRVAGAA